MAPFMVSIMDGKPEGVSEHDTVPWRMETANEFSRQ